MATEVDIEFEDQNATLVEVLVDHTVTDVQVVVESPLPPEVIEVHVDPSAAQTAIDAAAAAQAAIDIIQGLIDGFNPGSLTPFYGELNCTGAEDPAQTFDLEKPVVPMCVVLNEGRILKKETEWTIAGNIITILYDSLEVNDKIYVSGFEGTIAGDPGYIGDVGPDVGSDVG